MVVRFLARCFLTVVVFFLLLAAFDYVFSKVAERANYQPVEIWHDVLGGTVDADVVALGNSLVTVGFNTEYMDSVLGVGTYALGFSGSQFDRQSYMYSLYRAKNRPPKVVVNFVDHNAMSLTTRVPNRDQFSPFFPIRISGRLFSRWKTFLGRRGTFRCGDGIATGPTSSYPGLPGISGVVSSISRPPALLSPLSPGI